MLTDADVELDVTFAALADPIRRSMLRRLSAGDATVGELSQPFPVSGPAISRHLRVLERAKLITRRVDGQHRRCRLNPGPLASAVRWLQFHRDFWNASLDRLAEEMEKPSHPERKSHARTNRTRK